MNITKNTKIVCTIGPASDTYETCKELYQAGMNIMRLNFSHGTHEEHKLKLDIAERLEKEDGIIMPVMLDTKGPEIRTNDFEGGKATLVKGSTVRISMKQVLGTAEKFSVTYPQLYDDIAIGHHIKLDDGNITLTVVDKDEANHELITVPENTMTIKDKRGVNCPEDVIKMDYISAKDYDDLTWGCTQRFNFIAASFVRTAQDVLDIRKILLENNRPDIKIISKIENPLAVKNIDSILKVTDAIMVARGDLGVEVPAEDVPVIQRELIHRAHLLGKPVITATQMLDSMKSNPNPTRAEVSDVANAVFESTDCVMLSAESASGDYPVLSAATQAKIARRMEKYINYYTNAEEGFKFTRSDKSIDINDAMANTICQTALLSNSKLIVCFSSSSEAITYMSRNRPCCPILFVTDNRNEAFTAPIKWGVYPSLIKAVPQFIEEMEVITLLKAKTLGIPSGSHVIITGSMPAGSPNANFMKIITIPNKKNDLID